MQEVLIKNITINVIWGNSSATWLTVLVLKEQMDYVEFGHHFILFLKQIQNTDGEKKKKKAFLVFLLQLTEFLWVGSTFPNSYLPSTEIRGLGSINS